MDHHSITMDHIHIHSFVILFSHRYEIYDIYLKPSDSILFFSGGIIYDVIVEPPSVGSTTDEHGHQRPVAFMPYRVNGQYIMEGLASSFMFSLGGAGMIILDQTHNPNTPKLNRMMLQFVGFAAMVISFGCCWVFMRMKLPGYMLS